MYKIKVQADNELKKFVISGKGVDDKFVSIAAAAIIDSLYRNGCPESLIKIMANRDPEIRKMVIYAMRKCFFERIKEGMEL